MYLLVFVMYGCGFTFNVHIVTLIIIIIIERVLLKCR